MSEYILQITLKSDTTLGSGVGLAGEVDVEVAHDELGLPYLHGRSVKGLLRAAQEELAFMPAVRRIEKFETTCDQLLGMLGDETSPALLHVGSARAGDDELREALKIADVPRAEVLNTFTGVRRQTSINDVTGAADENTLRSIRVLKHGLVLRAHVHVAYDLSDAQKGALAAMVASVRRIGTRRNRGLGRVETDLQDVAGTTVLDEWLRLFEKELGA